MNNDRLGLPYGLSEQKSNIIINRKGSDHPVELYRVDERIYLNGLDLGYEVAGIDIQEQVEGLPFNQVAILSEAVHNLLYLGVITQHIKSGEGYDVWELEPGIVELLTKKH